MWGELRWGVVWIAEKYFREAATGHVLHGRTLVAVADRFLGVGCSVKSSLHPHQPGLILPSSLNVRQKAAVATLCTLWASPPEDAHRASHQLLGHRRGVVPLPGGRPVVALRVAAWRCFLWACKKPGRRARKNGSRVSCCWQWCSCEGEADALGRRSGGRGLPLFLAATRWCRQGGGGCGVAGAGLEAGGGEGDVLLPVAQEVKFQFNFAQVRPWRPSWICHPPHSSFNRSLKLQN